MADLTSTGTSGYATGSIDTATTLVNNVSPTDAKHINGVAAACVQIETILGSGTTLKGSKADLVARLDVGIEADGKINLSAATTLIDSLFPIVPTGAVIAWSTATAPSGYLLCDNAAVSRTTYATLFGVIGTTYGAGDGSTTFNVPDMRGRTIVMLDGGAGRLTSASSGGANANTLAGGGGAQTHTLTTAEMPSHTHTHSRVQNGPGSGAFIAGGADKGYETGISTTSTGGGGAHSNTQPWIAINYIIKY